MLWIILSAVIVAALAILGYSRVTLVRSPGVEGIGDSVAVDGYDRMSRLPRHRIIQPSIIKELAKRSPQGTLVNIGCGPGDLAAAIARKWHGLKVVAMDIDPVMLKVARQNLSARGLAEQVSFKQGDVHNLPFQSSTVDFVVSALSLHHWRDSTGAMQEIHRVLKPEGQLLLYDLRRDCRRWFYWFLRFLQVAVVSEPLRRIDAPLDSLHASYTPGEMDALLSGAHFEQRWVRGGAGWILVWGCKGKP